MEMSGSKECSTSPTLTQFCLDMKSSSGGMILPVHSENKDNCHPVKDGLRQRKINKTKINPASHRKTRINSLSKQTLAMKPAPTVPPPCNMEADSIVPNHFLPPAKMFADDDDQDVSSDAFEETEFYSKACALCNRGMETRMMQGNLTRYDPTVSFDPFQLYYERMESPRDKAPDIVHEEPTVTVRRGPGRPPGKGRKKGTVVNGFFIISSNPNLPLDMVLFGTSQERDIDDLFEPSGHTWCHSCCAVWSEGVQQEEMGVKNVDRAVFEARTEKCEHCNNYGASVACSYKSCTKKFHYICASSAGCFQDVKSKTVLCVDHIDQAMLVGDDAKCSVCDEIGDLTNQLFCCNCWRHYHGKCLQPEVDVLPSTRMGWHCPVCKICNDCGLSGDDSKMLVCDLCDKGYHFYCLKPPVTTVPKFGWKCENCRRCQDCGSSTPGSGATSRWHLNYTVCDSCYQQRNKGLSCPQCGKAYRHFSDIPMLQCKKCEKSVHRECDEAHANMSPYRCANCRVHNKLEPLTNDVKPVFDEKPCFDEEHTAMLSSPSQLQGNEVMLPSMSDPSLSLDININLDLEANVNIDCSVESVDSYEMGEKLPFDEEMEVELKDDEFSPTTTQFPDSLASRPVIAKKSTVSAGKQGGKRKLGSRRPRQGGGGTSRRRGKTGRPGSKLKNKAVPQSLPEKENQPDAANNQEDPSKHVGESLKSSLVLFSTDDQRMKSQDMCRCCGSFGQGVEGHLIPCSQCGQCYHPYCVNVKINKVIITKGWRCLDCTFCEGCGKGSDEARLLLCDNCDISYHTYCLDPPLDHVPHGGWKCKWCVACTLCSRTTPGKSCKWMSNYTLCGPCASLTTCPICKTLYKVDDLMIQCIECERWLHAYCDQFTKEEDVERAADVGYKCYYCRPKSQSYFSITTSSSMSMTARWSQSTVNTITSMSSYGFGTFGPSSPKATSIQHYRPGPGRKPLHPVQRHGSKGTVETSLASRIALGNTGESCSPAVVFLTESGKRHIDESKRRNHNKVMKKRPRPRSRVKKDDAGKNAVINVDRVASSVLNAGAENIWPSVGQLLVKKAIPKKRVDLAKAVGSTAKDAQKVQENFFGRSLLMSTSTITENSPRIQAPSSGNIAPNDVTASQPVQQVSWPTPPAPAANLSVTARPPIACAPATPVPTPIEDLPAAPDLNLPDPDVLVNQLGMLVTAAEGENMRTDPLPSNQSGGLTTDTRTGYPDGSVPSGGSHCTTVQEGVHSLSTEQRRQPSHELDILVPPGDLPMVDSKDIEDFFTGIEIELNQRQTDLIADPLLSSAGVHVASNPVPQRPPPPPYPGTQHSSREQYPREIHNPAWGSVPVGQPPPYQAAGTHPERIHGNVDMIHSTNGSRVEPEFEHVNDDFGPRRPRPESPRADSHKQILKWQEDEKLGAMATISPVLYANLNYPNLRDEYPEWVPRYRAISRLWRKLRTEEREPFRLKARDNRVKLKDHFKRTVNGASKFPSNKEPGVSANSQLTAEPQVPSQLRLVNGMPKEQQSVVSLPSSVESEGTMNAISYPGIAPRPSLPSTSNTLINKNAHVNMVPNAELCQSAQLTPQQNAQCHFPNQAYQQPESLMNMTSSDAGNIAEGDLMSPTGALTTDVTKKDRTPKRNRGERDKEKELKDKKNQIWQEREREWKLLQQQRQLENRKQQLQQNQDNFALRKEARSRPNKTPDWRKNSPQNDSAKISSQMSDQHSQIAASTNNDNTIQVQLSDYMASAHQPNDVNRADQNQQRTAMMPGSQTERVVEHSQSTSSFQLQTVVTTAITSVENPVAYWTQDTSRGNSRPATPARTLSSSGQSHEQNWLGQHEQQQHTQHTLQLQISEPPQQMLQHEVQQEQHMQLGQQRQQEQSGFNQPSLPLNVTQVPASSPNTSIPTENHPHHPRDATGGQFPTATQHLPVTRPDIPTAHLGEVTDASLEQSSRQKQQEALQKQQQIQQLQKQQHMQQQEVLQREQRKQLVIAQQQQQEYIQMHLNHQRFPQQQQQQPYQAPQPPRQANQFTANSKEMPEIDTEEEHQERLQFLYQQRQLQKQLQARQYMIQQRAPAPANIWVNNAQMMQGLPQSIPTDPIQQRFFLEQQRASQRHDLERVNMEKVSHGHHAANPFNQPSIPTPAVEAPKFNFHQLAKNGQTDPEFLSSTQVTQVSSSTFSTPVGAKTTTSNTAIFSESVSGKNDKRKPARKDRRNCTIDLSTPTHAGHIGAGFSNAVETDPQLDVTLLNHSENAENEMLAVSQETCVTVDEGNVSRVETVVPSFGNENDRRREQENQSTGEELKGKSLILPYGAGNPAVPNNPANQLVLPPPQLSLPPQQQHMLLQAQQQQLLWQQAHAQLQHQYQLFYQQLQQLQIQLQQTQDRALHQRVLRQQQQLRFLQTQILQHWQQGQIVVQQIHLQAFGLNAMLNQMDPAQQKHMQVYQQELVRQQQQWAQQFGGAVGSADLFARIPGIPQENRPQTSEEKPKRNRRSRAKAKSAAKDPAPSSNLSSIESERSNQQHAGEQQTEQIQNTREAAVAGVVATETQNEEESRDGPNDPQQQREGETIQGVEQHERQQGQASEKGLQREDNLQTPEAEQHQSLQPKQQQQELTHEQQAANQPPHLEQQHYQQDQQSQSEDQITHEESQQQQFQFQQLIQQQQQLIQQQQSLPQQQFLQQQQKLQQHQQQLLQQQQVTQLQQQQQILQPQQVPQQQYLARQQSYQGSYNHHHQQQTQQQNQQAEQQQQQQGQQHLQQHMQHPPQPLVDRSQLQLPLQHRLHQPTNTQQQVPSFHQQQGSSERQLGDLYRTHGEISSSVNHCDLTRDHPQAVLERRSTPDGRGSVEGRPVSDGSFRPPDHNASRPSPINDVPQRNAHGSPVTATTPSTVITRNETKTVTVPPENTTANVGKDAENASQAPKALEKLEMMVADMEDQAKKTEVETARRAEDMQCEEFLSDSLTIVKMPTCASESGGNSVELCEQNTNTPTAHPETMKNELAGNVPSSEETVAEGVIPEPFKNCHELNSPKGSAARTFIANSESKDLQSRANIVPVPNTKDLNDELRRQEMLGISKGHGKEHDEQLRIKRQLQIQERDRKLTERKRMKGLHSDRKHGKKETTRSRSTKSKKVKLTDEAIVQSLKELPQLQLCEPEFLMSSLIIQPTLNGLSSGQAVFRGSFGHSYIAGVDDYYASKRFPDIKVCLGNPPTPPTSLPPSPTLPQHAVSKEQRVYDMLAERTNHSASLFPTPPYGDSGPDLRNSLSKDKVSNKLLTVDRLQRRTQFDLNEDPSRSWLSSHALQNTQHEQYPAFVIDKGLSVRSRPENSLHKETDVNKIYSDVNVTLTISAISDKTVHETVNAISKLIDVESPAKVTVEPPVRTASAVYLDTQERIGIPRNATADKIDERIVSTLGSSDTKKCSAGSELDGPYCRHCDVVILGIGVVRNSSAEDDVEGASSSDNKTVDYSNVNIEDGTNEGRDVFCSSACLKQYYSLDTTQTSSSKESSTAATPEEELMSQGLTTSNELVNNENIVRGDEVAEGMTSRVTLGKTQQKTPDEENVLQEKRSKRSQWRRWKEAPSSPSKTNELSDDEIFQLLVKHGMATESTTFVEDRRCCVLCSKSGDGETNGTGRLLNVDLDAWVHLNCALWSHEVYETQNGALMNVEVAVKRGEKTECVVCHSTGATILCSKLLGACLVNCSNSYHFQCARDNGCLFFKDKTVFCPKHQSDYFEENILPSHAVFRKVFVNRQEIEQIAKMLNHNQTSEKPYSFRIGNLILNSIGQLLPHQVQAFHTRDSVYPVGFSTTRIYWSMRVIGRRCRYLCHVKDVDGDPHFVVKVVEEGYEEVSFDARTPRDAWMKILEPVESQRKDTNRVNLFPGYITGEDLFGLSEPLIVRIVESMPGVDQMQGYNMRYGRSPVMELPLAINPSGCARSEPLLRTHFKRPARARRSTKNASSATAVVVPPEEFNSSVYSKQFQHSKTQQYRKLKSEWRSNVLLGRSRIQGLGLFANRDLEGNNMVIEYIGSIIRNEVANKRERIYESQNHGVYMFRIDNDSVIDATIAGGPARYINHSCQPNCVAEVVRFEREQKIIIISNRRIEKGEELTYDYKFDFEDDQHKIPCLCGAVNCRKWMN